MKLDSLSKVSYLEFSFEILRQNSDVDPCMKATIQVSLHQTIYNTGIPCLITIST